MNVLRSLRFIRLVVLLQRSCLLHGTRQSGSKFTRHLGPSWGRRPVNSRRPESSKHDTFTWWWYKCGPTLQGKQVPLFAFAGQYLAVDKLTQERYGPWIAISVLPVINNQPFSTWRLLIAISTPRKNVQNFLTLEPPNYSIWIFTHLKLCLADAIHNFKWVKIIQIWQNRSQLFSNLAGWCHILFSTYLKCGN